MKTVLEEAALEYASECQPSEVFTETDVVDDFGSKLLDEFSTEDLVSYLIENEATDQLLESLEYRDVERYVQKNDEDWEKIGEIGVDAGCVLLGDPCYFLGDDATYRVKDWKVFCNVLEDSGLFKNRVANLHEGGGIVVSSGYGDGKYDVYVKRDNDIIKEVKVVFV